MKPKILVTHSLFPEVMTYLDAHTDVELGTEDNSFSPDKLKARISDKEGLLPLLVDTVDRDVMEAAPVLKIIANCAAGYNNIDIGFARERGILVTNTPGVLTEATADLTWALILAVARRILQADRFTREGRFDGWKLHLFLGKDLAGKRIGVVGMGRIGRAVAARAGAFRMEVVYADPTRLPRDEEDRLCARHVPFEDLLRSADIVSLHVNLTPETHHLISYAELAVMKPQAILINVSRGPVIDEEALVSRLADGHLWGVGLDVYEHEPQVHPGLLRGENVVLLPHLGSATRETRLRMAMTAARNLVQGLKGERPDNLVG